ncbi:cutinase family protein [Blastococcus sp. SYSU DS0510]
MKLLLRAFLALLMGCAGLVVVAPSASAAAVDDTCGIVEAVWVRGSGQALGATENNRFRSQLESRVVSATTTLHYFELGSDPAGYGGHVYEAITVGEWYKNGNAIGARLSGGLGNDYGRSINSGVGELYNYLLQRLDKCQSARFVLGGYSQGAQVVGQTLEKMASENPGSTDRIDFSALFGDPKLYLPEGEGIWPAACRGEGYSTWRRIVPDCDTDNGSLGARKPYLPTAVSSKVGLWCADDDFVCGSDKRFSVTAGHFTYAATGGAIDDAVLEIARRLRSTVPAPSSGGINVEIGLIGAGTTGLDVAFVIDTTGSMGPYIEQAKAFARSAAASIQEQRGRVALIAYRDIGDAYTATIFSGLSGDLSDFQVKLDGLSPSGGGDLPEALLHALMTTLNGLDWRPGATKAAIVLTDAGFHNPDRVDGSTVEQVAARALEIDPVNVYPIVPEFLAGEYAELAELTTGQVIVNSGDTVGSLTTALTRLRNRPVVLLPQADYYGQPGEQFTFDASRSYVVGSSITGYEWDFEGDGVFDQTTTTPVATHRYAAAFDGSMQVRVTAADGGIANASAFVHVGTAPPRLPTPAAPINVTVQEIAASGDNSTVRLSWTPADGLSNRWAVSVGGVPVGLSGGAGTTSVEITDVNRLADVTFGVAGVTADDVVGAEATVVLPKRSTTPPVATPTIDIAPGSADNPINLRSRGVTPVAVLSTASFDATRLDVRSLCFGDAEAPAERDCTESHGRVHAEDANRDGRLDAVLHFDTPQLGVDAGDTRACASGRLPSGAAFESCDAIRVQR